MEKVFAAVLAICLCALLTIAIAGDTVRAYAEYDAQATLEALRERAPEADRGMIDDLLNRLPSYPNLYDTPEMEKGMADCARELDVLDAVARHINKVEKYTEYFTAEELNIILKDARQYRQEIGVPILKLYDSARINLHDQKPAYSPADIPEGYDSNWQTLRDLAKVYVETYLSAKATTDTRMQQFYLDRAEKIKTTVLDFAENAESVDTSDALKTVNPEFSFFLDKAEDAQADIVKLNMEINGQMESLKTQVWDSWVLIWIVGGVGAAALLLTLAALLIAVGKVGGKRFTSDLERFDENFRTLAEKDDNQEKAMNRSRESLLKLNERMKELTAEKDSLLRRIEELEKTRTEEKKPVAPLPEPVVQSVPLARMAKDTGIRLNYNRDTRPFLEVSFTGRFHLLDDNTIVLSPNSSFNRLSSWRNNGYFYLYNVMIDGTVIDEDRVDGMNGSYEIQTVERRPVVAAQDSSNAIYNVAKKGVIRMKRI